MARLRILVSAILIAAMGSPASAANYDVVIRGGRVVDGTGAPWYVADIGIRGGKIVRVGNIAADQADTVIEAKGLVVAPGFIDMMGQTATPMYDEPEAAVNLLTQGITTINAGEGASAAPLDSDAHATRGWQSMSEYFQLLELRGLPVNVVQTVGHTQIRRLVMGDVDRRPGDKELAAMKALVAEAMQAGAIGVSTALIYPPAVYARTQEIAELAKVAGRHGGRYYTHMRNEGDRLIEAIDEALDIGRAAQAPVHIFHLKAAGRQNWGKMQQAIARIKAARVAGQQVTADIYPYVNNGLGIAALIHPRHFAAGRAALIQRLDDPQLRAEIRQEMETTDGWENWFRHVGHNWKKIVIGQSSHKRYADHVGKSLAAIADACDEDPWDTFFELVKSGAFALPESMSEANKILALQQEFISFCTDVGPAGGTRIARASHPRAFGSFPRLLSRYVRELGAVSLERAVAQASAVAANDVMAYDRGRIAVGLAADVIVFDYQQLTDRATFAKPHEISRGMKYVLVNGQLVLDDAEYTGKRPGRVLRGPGYVRDKAPFAVASGTGDERLASFDRLAKSFMEKHRLPGMALAVTDQGRLVYARGFGYADLAARQQVAPTSLFRIASISKPVTAAGILKLVEAGKLKLSDKVLDYIEYEPFLAKDAKHDRRLRNVTIRQCLQHRGGWDRSVSFDAMFQSIRFAEALGARPPADNRAIIRNMHGVPLDFEPGERYAYSNYGYMLLGRVIEKVTGESYEQWIKANVLTPIGIRSMRVGRTHLKDRSPAEVRYYSPFRGPSVFADNLRQSVPNPYGGWYLESMDSHGGWIASAVDLARFACALDPRSKAKLLSDDSLAAMYARPPGSAGHTDDGEPKEVFYSLGWFNRVVGDGKVNHWHTGSLAGTATILIQRHDGRNFIALFNARSSPAASHMGRAIDRLLHRAADEVEEWPEVDLFGNYD